ncbi:MAG TPA: hypothetical protein VHH32_00275 [Gemmatimonadales bacterium]|nr:hypothetical protein [Gemmatimonadales bacterium]
MLKRGTDAKQMATVLVLAFLMLLPGRTHAQERPDPPVMAGKTVLDAVVAPVAQFVDHGWQPIPLDSTGMPAVRLPFYWYQPTAGGKSLAFIDVATVKVQGGLPEEGEGYWVGGQLIEPVDDSIRHHRLPLPGQILVDTLVPGGVFVLDSTATMRTRVLSMLERVFPDSFARPAVSHFFRYLPKGSAPLIRMTVQRASPAGQAKPALLLVEAERCLIVAQPNDCMNSRVIDLWLLDQGSGFQVLTQRGPFQSDSHFKTGGGNGLSALAWLEIERRRFLFAECRSYFSTWTVVLEVLPTAVRQVYPKGGVWCRGGGPVSGSGSP